MRHIENSSETFRCPDCYQQIHETNPWEYLREDKTLEEIIFKLIPGLWKEEKQNIVDFYTRRGLSITNYLGSQISMQCTYFASLMDPA